MRLAAIASALAIVLCGAVFGAILLQKASILVPASAPPQATPTESRAPTVADSAAESAVAAPERRQLAQPSAASAEKRIALVIGNAGYQVGALATPANDAGLVAQTLQAAGFDVVGARDLDQDSLRRAFRDFLEKATGAGPDTSRSSMSAATASSSRAKTTSFRSMRRSHAIPTWRPKRYGCPTTSGRWPR
jgi:hypothetical protein